LAEVEKPILTKAGATTGGGAEWGRGGAVVGAVSATFGHKYGNVQMASALAGKWYQESALLPL